MPDESEFLQKCKSSCRLDCGLVSNCRFLGFRNQFVRRGWDFLCGRLLAISYPGKAEHDKDLPIVCVKTRATSSKQSVSFICVGSCVVFFFGLFWRKAKGSCVLMSTIAETTPTRSRRRLGAVVPRLMVGYEPSSLCSAVF